MTIQHLRSSTANKRPLPGSMSDGQIAVNTNTSSPGLFFKDSAGALIKVGPVHVGTTAPNASPASGGETGNSVGEQWLDTTGGSYVFKVWDGSAWRSETGTFVDVNGDVMTGALGIIAGSASAPGLYFSGDTNTGIYSPGADQVAISTNSTGRLFIDGSGNLLVGANANSGGLGERLSINGAGLVTQSAAQTNRGLFGTFGGSTQVIGAFDNIPLEFRTNNTERLRITSDGKLGLGTSTPTNYGAGVTSFSVNGSAGGIADFYYNGSRQGLIGTIGSNQMVIDTASNTIPLTLKTNNVTAITIDTSQRVGVGTSAPGSSLHVNSGATGTVAKLESTGTGSYLNFVNSSGSSVYVGAIATSFFVETNGSERARIDSSGRLLVGTSTSITNALQGGVQIVGTGADAYLTLTRFDTITSAPAGIILGRSKSGTKGTNTAVADGDFLGVVEFTGADGGSSYRSAAQIAAYVDGAVSGGGAADMPGRLVFSTTADGASSPTERMRISNTGKNSTYSTADSFDIRTSLAAGTGSYLIYAAHSATGVGTGGTNSLAVYTNGNIQNTNGSYTTLSDAKLKENIVDAGSQWNDLKAIQIRNWNFKAETGHETHRQIGPIAQELETVCPGLVFEIPDRDADGNETGEVTKGVNQSVLYMKAVKALQEAMERIEQLETEMAVVKAKLP